MSKQSPAKQPAQPSDVIAATLHERGSRYGEFEEHARITQNLKAAMYDTAAYQKQTLSAAHKEALEMIQHKIGRILNGDPNYDDSWLDIEGYARLGRQACKV